MNRLSKNGKIRKDERDEAQKLGYAKGFNTGYDEGLKVGKKLASDVYAAAMLLLDMARGQVKP